MANSYYQDQINHIELDGTYPPTIKIRGGVKGETKWLSLNPESATTLIEWLKTNFVDIPVQDTQK